MPPAPKPHNEAERQKELLSYGVLDTPEEQRFDDLTELAAKVLGTPVALISLVDSERQWFKSKHGLEVRETPRDHAFCAYAILDRAPFIVKDAAAHERVSDNPFVIGEPKVRFYAGVPIVTPRNHILGTLCVIDFNPRDLSGGELEILQALARQVSIQLEYGLALKEVVKKNQELKEAREYAEEGERAKSEFLSHVSHELRTPLNSIVGFSRFLGKESSRPSSGREADALQAIQKNAERLLKLINNILAFSGANDGAAIRSSDRLNLPRLVREIVDELAPEAERKGLALRFQSQLEEEFSILGDRKCLQEAVTHLVENGLRFTDQGSVELTLAMSERESEILLAVRDTGCGIKESDRERLFCSFTQIDRHETRHGGGIGIGLAVAKRHVEAHGGRITVASEPGKGTVFEIALPLQLRLSAAGPERMTGDSAL